MEVKAGLAQRGSANLLAITGIAIVAVRSMATDSQDRALLSAQGTEGRWAHEMLVPFV